MIDCSNGLYNNGSQKAAFCIISTEPPNCQIIRPTILAFGKTSDPFVTAGGFFVWCDTAGMLKSHVKNKCRNN